MKSILLGKLHPRYAPVLKPLPLSFPSRIHHRTMVNPDLSVSAAPAMCGAFGGAKQPDEEVHHLLQQVKPQVEEVRRPPRV
jgi:hypothetical protein